MNNTVLEFECIGMDNGSKCEWFGNPGQWNDEPYIADDGAETQQNA